MNLISIVMPVYNGENYIRESIDSILYQTYTNFELIIVNDGSTDNTQRIIESYKDYRIKFINNEHNFINSLNLGISSAQGKYIARMDADDIMFPHRLQKQLDFMEQYQNVDVCGGSMKLFGAVDNKSNPIANPLLLKLSLMYANQLSHPTVMMKTCLRELFPKENNIYQIYQKGYDCAEDYKLWIDLTQKKCIITNISDILIKYRISEFQVTRNNQLRMIKSSLRIQAEYIEWIAIEIITNNKIYETFLDLAFDLFNENNIQFSSLREIVHSVYKEFLERNIER